MADWGPVLMAVVLFVLLTPGLLCQIPGRGRVIEFATMQTAVVLFVLLTPGLLCQIPGRGRVIEFATMQTSGVAILVHTIIFFGLITIFLIAIGVHIYTG